MAEMCAVLRPNFLAFLAVPDSRTSHLGEHYQSERGTWRGLAGRRCIRGFAHAARGEIARGIFGKIAWNY